MAQQGRTERNLEDLTVEELEREGGIELPDREALSPLTPRLPVDPSLWPVIQSDEPSQGIPSSPASTEKIPGT